MKNLITKYGERLGIFKITKFFARRELKILMYHRIVNHPFIGGITPELFDQQMQYVKANFVVLSVNEILRNHRDNKIIPNSVAITFDDGHKDFYDAAWPVLRKHQIPATLYVTTGFVDGALWLWPDLLKYILLESIGKTVSFNGESYSLTDSNVLMVWNTIADQLLLTPTEERKKILNQFAKDQKVEVSKGPVAPFNAVSWDNLREMVAEGLDVGSHSVTHPILSDLSGDALDYEMEEAKNKISKELGFIPEGVCYPNGTARDINLNVEKSAAKFYRYGVVAFPCGFDLALPMRVGRYSGSTGFEYFKRLLNGAVLKVNRSGLH